MTKNSLLVYVLKFFEFLAVRRAIVALRERDKGMKGPGSTLRCDFFLFNRNTLNNRSRLRNGQLRRPDSHSNMGHFIKHY